MLALALLAGAARAQVPMDCPPLAEPPSDAQLQRDAREARDRGFLWRVSKDGHDSYLYGTLHAARRAWMHPGPGLTRALAASDTIALELDLLDPDVRERLARGLPESADTPPLPLALQRRLNRRAQAECLPPQMLDGLGAELQVSALLALAGRRDGLDPSYGIDLALAGWGRAAGKSVVSLETPELQLQALRMPNVDERNAFVAGALDELESGTARPLLVRLAQVWAAADLDTLTRYEAWCGCLETPADRAAMTRLLETRNPGLADGIEALHAAGKRVFAAVGSLHMIGATGLPALMAQRGFRVERIVHPR